MASKTRRTVSRIPRMRGCPFIWAGLRVMKLCVNTILYITSANVETEDRPGPARKKPKDRTGPAGVESDPFVSAQDVVFLPGKINISRLRDMREMEQTREGRKLMVRGHWRRPNPNWKDRRPRWIEPYWKGPTWPRSSKDSITSRPEDKTGVHGDWPSRSKLPHDAMSVWVNHAQGAGHPAVPSLEGAGHMLFCPRFDSSYWYTFDTAIRSMRMSRPFRALRHRKRQILGLNDPGWYGTAPSVRIPPPKKNLY